MWESNILTSSRGNSVRRILAFALAAFFAAFFWILLETHTANAASDATWQNGSIQYAGNTYPGPHTADGKTDPKLPSGTTYYGFVSTADVTGNAKAYVIYFSSGVDPGSAKSADYVTYKVSGSNSTYSNESSVQKISITPNATASGDTGSTTSTTSTNTCQIDGIGWIVCPVTNFLASSMDNVFNLLKGFLTVPALTTTTRNNALYTTWNYMRTFANVAFVIAFLLIIYSQLTNVGISNYSIKKLLPRLIIAAILVNISYFVCAVAVDLSNIIGDSLDNLLIMMRQGATGPNTNNIASWQSVSGYVLSGGAAAAAAGVGIAGLTAATGASVGSAIILLLPMLLGLLLAVLVALVVLAARQAVIVVLIILSPLAFVAYLLPNTEKWFERWRKTFTELLVFFPLFSLIFGGSQLASFIIIQNATQINIILLAMFVQVAPLVLTPLLIRFSGNIVGKVAGVINNPKKGLLDRTRSWAQDRSQLLAAKSMANPAPVRRRQVFRRYALGYDQARRNREEDKKNYGIAQDNRYHASNDYQKRHNTAYDLDVDKKTIESRNEEHSRTRVSSTPRILERELTMKYSADRATLAQKQIDNIYDESKSGKISAPYGPATQTMTTLVENSAALSAMTASEAARGVAASNMQTAHTAQALSVKLADDGSNRAQFMASQALLRNAGGIDPAGITRAQANASAALVKIKQEEVENTLKLLSGRALQTKTADGKGVTVKDYTAGLAQQILSGASRSKDGLEFNPTIIESVFEQQATEANITLLEQARQSRAYGDDLQSALSRVFTRNAGTLKQKGGFHLQSDPKLQWATDDQMNLARLDTLSNINSDQIKDAKAGWFQSTAANIEQLINTPGAKPDVIRKVHDSVRVALQDANTRGSITDRLSQVRDIDIAVSEYFGIDPVPLSDEERRQPGDAPDAPADPRESPSE